MDDVPAEMGALRVNTSPEVLPAKHAEFARNGAVSVLSFRVFHGHISAGLVAVALWPVWAWMARRMVDGSDEAWGLVALLAAVALMARDGTGRPRLGSAAAVLALYAATFGFAPALVRGGLGIGALALVLMPGAGAAGLLVLSLPVLASAQFFAGYPLRVLTAVGAEVLLRAGGLGVGRAGTMLEWRGELVMIDAPCSGVKMLWGGLFLACALCGWLRLSWRATIAALAGAVGIVLAANVVRAAFLFLKEAHVWRLPEWTHAAIGVAVFLAAALAIAGLCQRFPARMPEVRRGNSTGSQAGLFGICCLAALLVPMVPHARKAEPARAAMPAWPAGLTEMPLGAEERRFADDFPGEIKVLTDGRRRWIARWVTKPTRKLHSSADCFRGLGYRVEMEPLFVEPDGTRWCQFSATRGSEKLTARERITDAQGGAWTDVSAWFWSAAFGKSQGPWMAVTVVE